MAESSTFDPPLTAEDIERGEANRRKPMTAETLATIERDLLRYAEEKLDAGIMFLHACLLLREVRRLRAPEGSAGDRKFTIAVSGCGAPPCEMNFDMSTNTPSEIRSFSDDWSMRRALAEELCRRLGVKP